jgi:hypothetical protein
MNGCVLGGGMEGGFAWHLVLCYVAQAWLWLFSVLLGEVMCYGNLSLWLFISLSAYPSVLSMSVSSLTCRAGSTSPPCFPSLNRAKHPTNDAMMA